MLLSSGIRYILVVPALCLVLLICSACQATIQHPTEASLQTPPAVPYQAKSRPQRVSFASLDHNSDGRPVTINGLLFKPEGTGSRQLTAVVALHGCGGMYSSSKSKRDQLSIRHQMMADLLVSEGYAVLFPDSFRSRGEEEICTTKNRERTITQKHRRLDAQGALAWLQQRDDIRKDRVALLGWSHGGSAVLATLNAKQSAVAGWHDRQPQVPYFRAGAAFYPGCIESLKGGGYSLAAPLTLFIGGSDDWTAPGPCVDLADKLAKAGEEVTITVYPDTYHGFDGPANQPRQHFNVPNGVHPGRGVTTAANPAARADAYGKLLKYLRTYLVP